MADEQDAAAAAAEPSAPRDDVGVTLMGDVLEKLRVLQFDGALSGAKKKGGSSLLCYSETQFATSSLPAGAQFQSFLELATLLLALCGQPLLLDKYDDPTSSVNKLILALKTLGWPLDCPAARLKLGHGEAACAALDFLCDQALAARRFAWPRPQYPKEDFADEAEVDEDAEVDAAEDAALPAGAEEDAEELYGDLGQPPDALERSFQQMIVSQVDPRLWQTELERVGPRLKLRGGAGAADGKEWHAHLERARQHETVLRELLPGANAQLRLLSGQLNDAAARMSLKEKAVNNQFEMRRQEFAALRETLQAASELSKAGADRVNGMTAAFAETTEQLRETKGVMDDRGAKMTDTSPLVRIKDALKTLAAEIQTFELRLGVVGHTLLQAKSRQASGRGRQPDGQSYQDPAEFDLSDDDSN
ncbi:hypothetical protein BBJ28_00020211 [Nothophytophthora sp. Chile5]|nr:hypothetical protein BBJ28_00020211 [Nothophytophthora sp. Chile5]